MDMHVDTYVHIHNIHKSICRKIYAHINMYRLIHKYKYLFQFSLEVQIMLKIKS
jgi:hypothetical protein